MSGELLVSHLCSLVLRQGPSVSDDQVYQRRSVAGAVAVPCRTGILLRSRGKAVMLRQAARLHQQG